MSVIGIDLGTTFLSVAYSQNGKIIVIDDDQGKRKTPCCVAFTSVKRLVGRVAISQIESNPENTIYDVKRFLGKTYKDATRQQKTRNWPYKLQNKDGKPCIQVQYKGDDRILHPEEIISMVLSRAIEIAKKRIGKELNGAVITVPTSFNHAQRKATMDAANIAGIRVLGLINETTAAALVYAQQSMNEALKKKILMFHFGGGSFCAAVVNINGRKIAIKSAAGSSEIGGMEFDDILFKQSADEFRSSTNIDMRTNPRAVCRLQAECEKVKNKLNLMDETKNCKVKVDALCSGNDFESKSVNFHTLKTSAKDLLQAVQNAVDQAIQDAGLTCQQIQKVVLVGGASRLPLIPDVLHHGCGFEKNKICKMPNIDEVPARGAAAFAAILSEHEHLPEKDCFQIQEKLSYSLYVREADILQLTETIPNKVQEQLKPNEPTVTYRVSNKELNVVDRQSTEHEERCMILDVQGLHRLTVSFCAKINGMICTDAASDGSQRKRCYMECGLQKEEIDRLQKEAKEYAKDETKSDSVMYEVDRLERKTEDKIMKYEKFLAEINKISNPSPEDLSKWSQKYEKINDTQETTWLRLAPNQRENEDQMRKNHKEQVEKMQKIIIQTFMKKIDALKAEISNWQEEDKFASDTLQKKQHEIEQPNQKFDATTQKPEKSLMKTMQLQKDEIENLTDDNEKLQPQVQELNDAEQKQQKSSGETLQELKDESEKLTKENKTLQQEAQQLKESNQRQLMLAQNQREKEHQMRKDHKEKEEKMQKIIERLEEENEALKAERSNWQEEHKFASDTLQKKQYEIERPNRKLDDTSQQPETRPRNNVIPLSLGIETYGGVMSVIIPCNTEYPIRKHNIYTTVNDDQTSIKLSIFEGDRSKTEKNFLIGSTCLKRLRRKHAGVPMIKVSFEIDEKGMLHMNAREDGTGNEQSMSLDWGSRTRKREDIDMMIKQVEENRKDDKKWKRNQLKLINLRQYAKKKKRLVNSPCITNNVSSQERAHLILKCESTLNWIQENENAPSQKSEEKLNHLIEVFRPFRKWTGE